MYHESIYVALKKLCDRLLLSKRLPILNWTWDKCQRASAWPKTWHKNTPNIIPSSSQNIPQIAIGHTGLVRSLSSSRNQYQFALKACRCGCHNLMHLWQSMLLTVYHRAPCSAGQNLQKFRSLTWLPKQTRPSQNITTSKPLKHSRYVSCCMMQALHSANMFWKCWNKNVLKRSLSKSYIVWKMDFSSHFIKSCFGDIFSILCLRYLFLGDPHLNTSAAALQSFAAAALLTVSAPGAGKSHLEQPLKRLENRNSGGTKAFELAWKHRMKRIHWNEVQFFGCWTCFQCCNFFN